MNSLSVSKTSAKESALSSALSVMISSFPAHFRIFDMLENKKIRIKKKKFWALFIKTRIHVLKKKKNTQFSFIYLLYLVIISMTLGLSV